MIIVANWKAYVEDAARAKKLFSLAKRLTSSTRVRIVLAPSAPQLGLLAPRNTSPVEFAVQDISRTLGGAHTGEVTAPMVVSLGATYAILGHSERRATGDTDAIVAEKLGHALTHGLTPILCVGEKERDQNGEYLTQVRAQLAAALEAIEPTSRAKVVIAYEPLWAINKTAGEAIASTDLAEMVLYIRKVVAELSTAKSSTKTIVLYGGSVEPDNIRDLAGGSGVDGFLVGHASVDPSVFGALVKALA